mgnify:FL=1
MKIKAPVNTVIVEPITATERGGIALPGVSEDHQRARVVAVGDRVTRTGVHVPSELREEDIVVHTTFVGQPFTADGRELLSLPYHYILGVEDA